MRRHRSRLRLVLACLLATAPALTAAPRPAHAQADDWGVRRDPFDLKVIAQHKRFLAANPHDASALANLLKMYRQYRTVELLRDEYQKLLDKDAKDWSALVVLGHIQHKLGDDVRALDYWNRAVAQKPGDAATWVEIGAIHKGAGKNKEARAAYDKALASATAKDMKKKALRALADLALATNDVEAANAGARSSTADVVLFLNPDTAPTATQLRALSGDGTTLPLPVPAGRMTTSRADVGGAPATVLTSRDGTMALVVWVDNGVVTAVGGSLDREEVLLVARGLR